MEFDVTALVSNLLVLSLSALGGFALHLAKQFLGVRQRDLDRHAFDDMAKRAANVAVKMLDRDDNGRITVASRSKAVAAAVAYMRETSPDLLSRIGAGNDALTRRVFSDLTERAP